MCDRLVPLFTLSAQILKNGEHENIRNVNTLTLMYMIRLFAIYYSNLANKVNIREHDTVLI